MNDLEANERSKQSLEPLAQIEHDRGGYSDLVVGVLAWFGWAWAGLWAAAVPFALIGLNIASIAGITGGILLGHLVLRPLSHKLRGV